MNPPPELSTPRSPASGSAAHSPSVSANNSGKYHLSYLDGIRGFAALWVMTAHCLFLGGWMLPVFPDPSFAVDIFMCLSGYLMTYQSSRPGQDLNSRGAVTRFYLRRFFRLTPVYYLLLLVSFALNRYLAYGYHFIQLSNLYFWAPLPPHDLAQTGKDALQVGASAKSLLLHVTFLFGLVPKYTLSTFMGDWSLSLEVQFYIAFPFLLLFIRRWKYFAPAALAVAVTGLTAYGLSRLPPPVFGYSDYFPIPSFLLLKLPLFVVGILAAEACASFPSNAQYGLRLSVLTLLVAAYCNYYVTVVVAVMLYLGCKSQRETAEPGNLPTLERVLRYGLGNRITLFLADTSYSVYLIHSLIIGACGHLLFTHHRFLLLPGMDRALILLGVVAPASYAAGFVVHKCIELPGIALGKRIISKL